MKVAVLASGNGSNFAAIAQAINTKQISAEIVVLFSDKKNAFVLERAKKYGIPAVSFSPQEYASKSEYEAHLLHLLEENEVELIILAGYMRILGPTLLEAYPNRIINIHPSLLPAFPGLHGIKDAFEAKVKETGVTVHYVDLGVDTGPVIAQKKVAVSEQDTLESLETKIHLIEHQLYPQVIADIVNKMKE